MASANETNKNGLRAGNRWSAEIQPITADDLIKTDNDTIDSNVEFNKDQFDELIKKKLDSAAQILKKDYTDGIINAEKFDKIYITSDIHADYHKFIEILSKNELIDQVSTSNIYDPEIITNTGWKPAKTLLIIIGDLVDGSRQPVGVVDDPRGCFELYLHAFIYNLRLKARAKGSDILFTIGNHDFDTIYNAGENLEHYIHESAIKYFNGLVNRSHGLVNRRHALAPFYECSPYLRLKVVKKGVEKPLLICVHGGLHFKQNNGPMMDFSHDLDTYQHEICNKGLYKIDNLEDFKNAMENDPYSALWTRYYELEYSGNRPLTELNGFYKFKNSEDKDKCDAAKSSAEMVVVGHCNTHNSVQIPGGDKYKGCKVVIDEHGKLTGGGCVIMHCDKDTYPALTFVDIAMSKAFGRTNEKNEILELIHDPTSKIKEHYYNIVNRKDGATIETMFPHSGYTPPASNPDTTAKIPESSMTVSKPASPATVQSVKAAAAIDCKAGDIGACTITGKSATLGASAPGASTMSGPGAQGGPDAQGTTAKSGSAAQGGPDAQGASAPKGRDGKTTLNPIELEKQKAEEAEAAVAGKNKEIADTKDKIRKLIPELKPLNKEKADKFTKDLETIEAEAQKTQQGGGKAEDDAKAAELEKQIIAELEKLRKLLGELAALKAAAATAAKGAADLAAAAKEEEAADKQQADEEVAEQTAMGLRAAENAQVRRAISAKNSGEPVSATELMQTSLNIFGSIYDLTSNVDLRAAHRNLLQFLADFGITHEYDIDLPTIIKAFYCIFPGRDGKGGPRTKNYSEETQLKGGSTLDRLCSETAQKAVAAAGPQKPYDIKEDPAFHLICPYLNYRVLSLMMEIQLSRISALNANRLLEQRNTIKDLLKRGGCGAMTGPEAYAKFMAFLNKVPSSKAPTGQTDLTKVYTKLDQIMEMLRALIGFNIDCSSLDEIDGLLGDDEGKHEIGALVEWLMATRGLVCYDTTTGKPVPPHVDRIIRFLRDQGRTGNSLNISTPEKIKSILCDGQKLATEKAATGDAEAASILVFLKSLNLDCEVAAAAPTSPP